MIYAGQDLSPWPPKIHPRHRPLNPPNGIPRGLLITHNTNVPLSKLLVSPLIMENQMEKKMENEMETGIIWGL